MNTAKVVDIQIQNLEEHISDIIINYVQIFRDGKRKACRRNVKHLDGCYEFMTFKPIVSAQCLCKVHCGLLRNDRRLLFLARLADDSVQLIQAREGSKECLKLFELA